MRKIASSYGIEAGRVILDFTRAVGSHNPNCKKLAHVMCIHLFNKLNEHSDKPINLLENEIIEYIKKNYRRKSFSIQHISERFSLPTMVISKIVKKKTGKKFNDYVNYLRIEYAKTLFASEDIKTTAVCCDSDILITDISAENSSSLPVFCLQHIKRDTTEGISEL